MILRRAVEHLRKKEWTAIAIDFVIMALGVFVGLQAQAWNDGREDRLREALKMLGLAAANQGGLSIAQRDSARHVLEILELAR